MKSIAVLSLVLESCLAHMALTEPAPRRSPNHPGYRGGRIDYDMTSPLGGGGRTFPCRGAPKGPNYKTYNAGSSIKTHIAGSAKHMGGHCQFSLTYNEKDFVVLKTVLGNCITGSVDYDIPIPKDVPAGNVTFAWTWFNRIGNREIYMNCVDIEIKSQVKSGSIRGPKMVVANWPGYPTFVEGFADDYKKDLYDSQPIIAISPSANPLPSPPSKPTARPSPPPKPTMKPPPTPPRPTTTFPKPTSRPPSKPTARPPSSPPCKEGTWSCRDKNTLAICNGRHLVFQPCLTGTHCQTLGNFSRCIR